MCDIPQDYIIAYFYENIDGTDTVRYANGGITVNGSKPYRIEKMFYESDYLKLRAELVAVNKLANDVARAAAMWERTPPKVRLIRSSATGKD